MQYAVNVCDLTYYADDIAFKYLISIHIANKHIVTLNAHQIDGDGILLEKPEENTLALIQICQKNYPKLRFYQQTNKAWKQMKRL